jgi:hypothetical protein
MNAANGTRDQRQKNVESPGMARALWVGLPPVLTHRIATHLNTMGVVHQPVQGAIGQRGVANLFVPD